MLCYGHWWEGVNECGDGFVLFLPLDVGVVITLKTGVVFIGTQEKIDSFVPFFPLLLALHYGVYYAKISKTIIKF